MVHVIQKLFVGKLDFAAEGEAEEFAAELADDVVPALSQQVVAQPGHAFDVRSAEQRRFCVDQHWSESAEHVVLLEREAVRINPGVAFGTFGNRAVLLDQLPSG